jgi:hypothetical protein
MSTRVSILSVQSPRQTRAGATEAESGRIDTDAEDSGDLARLQSFPSPQPQHLLIVCREVIEGSAELGVRAGLGRVGYRGLSGLGFEPLHEPQVATLASSLVGERPSGDPVAPRKRSLLGGVVDPPPHREKHVREDVFGLIGMDSASQVAL